MTSARRSYLPGETTAGGHRSQAIHPGRTIWASARMGIHRIRSADLLVYVPLGRR